MQAANGRYIAMLDADLQNDPRDLPKFLEALEATPTASAVRASRTGAQGDNFVRQISSKIANGVRNWITHETVTDSGCCYRVFKRECIANLKFFKGMHRFLPTLFKIEGFTVTEIPVNHQHPPERHEQLRRVEPAVRLVLRSLRRALDAEAHVPLRVKERINFPDEPTKQ